MRKEDLTVIALLFEAIDILLAIGYIGLQIFTGIYYHASSINIIGNIFVLLLIYVGLTVLSNYPEKINRIPPEMCTGDVRKNSLRLIRSYKFIFVAGLMVPCIFDALGITIRDVYSLIVVGLIIVIAVYYEYKIIKELRDRHRD